MASSGVEPLAVEAAEQRQRLADGELFGEPGLLQRDADPLADLGVVRLPQRRPRTSTSPDVASSSPSRISMVVVLPAPLGPSRPKHSPRSTSRSSPRTASTGGFAGVRLDEVARSGPPASAKHTPPMSSRAQVTSTRRLRGLTILRNASEAFGRLDVDSRRVR